MKSILKKNMISISIGLLSATAFAAPKSANIEVKKDVATIAIENSINNILKKVNPSFKLNSITPLEAIPGLYEVVHNKNNITYMTADGSYLIDGSIILVNEMKNITRESKIKLSNIDFKTLPANPIVYKRGTGVNKIAVFSDPTCPYCKSFETELAKLKDVTISLYIIPILGDKAKKIAESVLCSKNASSAWNQWMIEGKTPEEKSCDIAKKKIETNIAFAKANGINGTPALIFENGDIISGMSPAETVESKFLSIKESKIKNKK